MKENSLDKKCECCLCADFFSLHFIDFLNKVGILEVYLQTDTNNESQKAYHALAMGASVGDNK